MKRKWMYKRVAGVVLSLVLFLGGVALVQNILDNQNKDLQDNTVVKIDEGQKENKEIKQEQSLKSPVSENIGIVRYFRVYRAV